MVIDQIDIGGDAIGKAENHTPVGADSDGPKSAKVALQGMKPKGWHIHAFDCARGFQQGQDLPQLSNVIGIHTSRRVLLE